MNTDGKSIKTLLKVSIAGTVTAARRCCNPVLVVLFGAVGLAAIVGYLDVVLFPALGIFVVLTIYVLWRKSSRENAMERKLQ